MCKNEKMLLLLSGHLDGCNTAEEEARLEAHLAECPDCRRILTEYEKIDAGIADLTQAPPANFTANVMRAVEAEPHQAAPAKPRKFSFGFATAVAAAAAIFLLAVGSGKLPQLGLTSAKLNDSAIKSADTEPMAADEPMAEAESAPAAEAEAEIPEATFGRSALEADNLPANVDCAALARAEKRPVGLLYAEPADLPELEGASSLPLNGGFRYEVTQETLDALAERFDDLQIFEPKGYLPEGDNPAYLIVVTCE